MEFNPPLDSTYKALLQAVEYSDEAHAVEVEPCMLPMIDLARVELDAAAREQCKRDMANASSEWGFFQVVNHGVPVELLDRVHCVQLDVFRRPFERKANERLLDYSPDSYRWGNPCATSLRQLSWSEAYHITTNPSPEPVAANTIRCTIEEYTSAVSHLAHRLARILAEHLGYKSSYFQENFTSSNSYLRLNRYPPCPAAPAGVFGLIPHTDSSFLTVLRQDEVGGLQLMKGGSWFAVKPIRHSLIVNIGDLFEALSNGEFRSVEHRVMANPEVERFSVAYFLCPSYDTVIESCRVPKVYRPFSFREFRQQVQEDVTAVGYKVGLPRFLV